MSEIKSGWAAEEIREWPYPLRYKTTNEISTDVLVLGGGLAGGFAAMAAAQKGAKVTLVEKAAMQRSGAAGGGLDHWQDVFIPGVSTVTAEQLAKARSRNHDGYAMEELFYTSAKEGWERLLDLERIGIKIRDTDDEYVGAIQRDERSKLLFAHDARANTTVIFWGAGPPGRPRGGVKYALYNECKRLGVEVYNRVMATSLLTEGGKQGARVVGATAVNTRTGEFYIFKAKATVVTTGWISRLWFYVGNEWRGTWGHEGQGATATATGDGIAMALRAGATLINMESSLPTLTAFASSNQPTAGVSGLQDSRGDSTWPSSVVDATGKTIPTITGPYRNPHGTGIGNVPFYIGPGGTLKREGETLKELMKEGKVHPPLYLDLGSLREPDRKVILEVNQLSEGGWLGQMELEVDWTKEKVETQRPYIPGYGRELKSTGTGGGILINANAETSLKGLYAGGDHTPGSCAASGAGVFGWRAGNSAADYAKKAAEPVVDKKQVKDEMARVYLPVERSDGVSWRELTLDTKYIMTCYCYEFKNEWLLKRGLECYDEVKQQEVPKLCAGNPHELVHALETLSIMSVGEAILHSSLARKASSESLGFFRTDYPEMDPPEWRKWVTIKMEDGKFKTGTMPIKQLK